MIFVIFYVLGGLCWVGYNLYILDTGELVRRKYRDGSPWLRVGAFLGFLLWPLLVLTALLGQRLMPQTFTKLSADYRRMFLDRDGLLVPKTPPPRCCTHDVPFETAPVTCTECGKAAYTIHCRECALPIPPGPLVCLTCWNIQRDAQRAAVACIPKSRLR
jgi:hypothetical protein